jgi:FdhD protein
MKKTPFAPVQIQRFSKGHFTATPDLLAEEVPLEIRLQFGPAEAREERALAVTMRTPGQDAELALGFLFTENLIQDAEDVLFVRHCENTKPEAAGNVLRVGLNPSLEINWEKLQRHSYTSSSCGVCGKTSIENVQQACPTALHTPATLRPEVLLDLPEKLREAQAVFSHTGGLHACGLFTEEGELLGLREDVGRHNAADKLIGHMLQQKIRPAHKILLLSGRASFELVQKALMFGFPAVAAVGAPSSLAVSLADAGGLTLVGFLRCERFNVYTHPQRFEGLA